MARGAWSVAFVLIAGVVAGCSAGVAGNGTVAADAVVPQTARPAPTSSAAPSPGPSPSATPLDADAVARAVNLRQADFPAGWKPVPGSGSDEDSANWAFQCARDASVPPGTLSGAATPDFSRNGRNTTSQLGSVTGVFPDAAAAERYVALFRQSSFGACLGAEAVRAWRGTFTSPPAFVPLTFLRPGLEDTSAMAAVAGTTQGRRTIQFFAMRSGRVVTMLNTYWVGNPDNVVVDRVSGRMATRLRSF